MSNATPSRPKVLGELPSIFTTLSDAKTRKKLSFEQIAQQLGRNELYTVAIFYGQAKPTQEDLQKLSQVLDLRYEYLEASLGPEFFPERGLGEQPPRDPVLVRLQEIVTVYGYPIKHLIHEKFGDGIMSAIDFESNVEREPNPAGDRVKITMSGKFLPYKRW